MLLNKIQEKIARLGYPKSVVSAYYKGSRYYREEVRQSVYDFTLERQRKLSQCGEK